MDRVIADGTVQVGPKAREIAPLVLGQTLPLLRPFSYLPSRLTLALLPDALREQFGYTHSPVEQAALDAFASSVRATVPRLPARIRFFPHYRRAMAMLRARNAFAA
jgi:uncharacterized protein (DUF2236 family)